MTTLTIDIERESDGRWLATIPELPGVMAYGATEAEARNNTIALALRVFGERVTSGETELKDAQDYLASQLSL